VSSTLTEQGMAALRDGDAAAARGAFELALAGVTSPAEFFSEEHVLATAS
jgi:hypothetical protein